jgi:diguanylate cyclase (GGDEF)-like protein/PAS domain S-box-containing protein
LQPAGSSRNTLIKAHDELAPARAAPPRQQEILVNIIRPAILALIAFTTSIVTTLWVWQHDQQSSRQKLQAQFEFGLSDISGRVAQRVNAYEQVLRGVQAFYSSRRPSRTEFSAYIAALHLEESYGGLQGVGFALAVPASELAAHVHAMRRGGFPDYAVHPASTLQLRAPIVQAEPFHGRNMLAIGFDPYTDTVRRHAMEQALERGEPTISGKLDFALDKAPDKPPSFILYAPVFKPGAPHHTPAMRRANLVGWVYAPVRMDEMMASLYGERDPNIEVSIYDGATPGSDTLLHNTGARASRAPESKLQATTTLEAAGHRWLIMARAHPGFEARHGRDESRLIAVSGFLMSLLLAVIAWLIAGSRARAISLASEMTKELRSSEERWKFALEGAGDGVWDRDLRTDTTYFSRRCREIFGYSEDEFGNHRDEWVKRIHPDDRDRALAESAACIQGLTRNFSSEYRLLCKNGDWKWVLSRGHVTSYDDHGKPLRLIGTVSDITARKHAEERIKHMAQHDPLTGLPNRALFFDRLRQALSQARRDDTHLALLFVDLDRFKPINDDHGHAIGDFVLQQVAQRLRSVVRESDTVGRIGGDEFVVLLREIDSGADANRVTDKIHQALAEPMQTDGLTLHLSASIGCALFPSQGEDEHSLMKMADMAMYQAKHAASAKATR